MLTPATQAREVAACKGHCGASWKWGAFSKTQYTPPRVLEATSAPQGWEMSPSYLAASFDSGPPLTCPHLSFPHSARETDRSERDKLPRSALILLL